MKKKNIIISISVIIIIIFILTIFKLVSNKNKQNLDNINKENSKTTNIYDKEVINEIKNEINATADTNMYQILEEYDGRQILQIKPNIQFETALAGILKQGLPKEEEISELVQNKPTKNGIWISKQSRDKFLNLLKENQLNNFSINEEGYLICKEESDNQNAKQLQEAIKQDKLYIIDISGTSYIRDEMSGKITQYPFEKMDPYQAIDFYQDENSYIIEVTTNEKGNLSNTEILEDILLNLE